MTDKEVGDSWRCSPLLPPPGERVVKDLIRKLVYERQLRLAEKQKKGAFWTNEEWQGAGWWALREFGIDPEEFQK